MKIQAGEAASSADLIDVDKVVAAYYDAIPDPELQSQRVSFGTSGHRGSSLSTSFNEHHIVAISRAIAEYRLMQGITGPLYIGADTHVLSVHAMKTAARVLQANGVDVLTSKDAQFVPTPAISHAILSHNSDHNNAGHNNADLHNSSGEQINLADGIVVTPSHNPPADGGIKYNLPHGGPADTDATSWIADRANELLELNHGAPNFTGDPESTGDPELTGEPGLGAANRTGSIAEFDFITPYVESLDQIIDMQAIANSKVRIAVHPLAGAAYEYWRVISARWGIKLDVLGPKEDSQWSFMTLDWDGQIRMDPSSKHAMAVVGDLRADYDLVLANDADADRFGIVTADAGLMQPNHVLAVVIDYLLETRAEGWPVEAQVGKTMVSSAIIDRVLRSHNRGLYEVPVGFKWFVDGLSQGKLVFGGEESAGASFLRKDGTAWSTDKDGIIMCLIAAEITAVTGKSVSEKYAELTAKLGVTEYERIDASATFEQKLRLSKLQSSDVTSADLAGDPLTEVITAAPGNGAAIGGLKVSTKNAWFAARPSGTEDVYKVYAESFNGAEHLEQVLQEAQSIVLSALK